MKNEAIKNMKDYDQVNVRLPVDLNDWLNKVVRDTKRHHGAKLPKEIIIETLIEFLQRKNLDWEQIANKASLNKQLASGEP